MWEVWLVLAASLAGAVLSAPVPDSPPGLLDSPELAWLLAQENQGPAPPARRITPKSVFVAPSFTGCSPGYRQDYMGRCVKVVKVNQAAQWDFLLQKLNAMYAPPPPPRRPAEPMGPFHVSLSLGPATTRSPTTARYPRSTTQTTVPPTTTTSSTTTTPPPTTTEEPTTPTTEPTTELPTSTTPIPEPLELYTSTEETTVTTTEDSSTPDSSTVDWSTWTDPPSTTYESTTDSPPSTTPTPFIIVVANHTQSPVDLGSTLPPTTDFDYPDEEYLEAERWEELLRSTTQPPEPGSGLEDESLEASPSLSQPALLQHPTQPPVTPNPTKKIRFPQGSYSAKPTSYIRFPEPSRLPYWWPWDSSYKSSTSQPSSFSKLQTFPSWYPNSMWL